MIIFPQNPSHEALKKVLRDARNAKRILNKAQENYSKVKGELSRTDLLYGTALKESYVGVFWMFVRSYLIRTSEEVMAEIILSEGKKEFDKTPEWEQLSKILKEPQTEQLIKQLVRPLVTDAKLVQSASSDTRYAKLLVNAVEKRNVDIEGLTDQTYLCSVKAWNNDQTNKDFVEKLVVEQEWAERFEYFQNAKSDVDPEALADYKIDKIKDYLRLIEQTNNFAIRKYGAEANSNTNKVFIILWRYFINSPMRNTRAWRDNRLNWTFDIGSRALPISFSHTFEWDYYWIDGNYIGLSNDEKRDLRRRRIDQFFDFFTKNPAALFDALPLEKSSKTHWTLASFLMHSYMKEGPELPISESQWIILSSIFKQLLKIDVRRAYYWFAPLYIDTKAYWGHDAVDEQTGRRTKEEPRTIPIFTAPTPSSGKAAFFEVFCEGLTADVVNSDPFCEVIYNGVKDANFSVEFDFEV